jgi:ATP dependent DNA ligase domain
MMMACLKSVIAICRDLREIPKPWCIGDGLPRRRPRALARSRPSLAQADGRPDRGRALSTGLDWTHKYPPIAAAALGARQAYLDGEMCGVFPDGITSFSMIQAASDAGNAAGLVYFIFDLLHLDGDDVGALPLTERKARLAELLSGVAPPLHYSDLYRGRGPAFHAQACKLELEGIVCKRADATYAPGNRGHCTSFSIPIAICRRHIPVAPASRPTRSRLRSPATCRPSDPVHRGAARSFPRNSSMDVRCCGVRNDIVGAAQDCSRGPD